MIKHVRSIVTKKMKKKDSDAAVSLLQEAFNDLYDKRLRIYRVNFVRGVVFGVGSVIGGTVVIAILVWVLSIFVDFPLIGDIFKEAQTTIQQRN